MMASANTDPELRRWLRWAAEGGNTPNFVVSPGLPYHLLARLRLAATGAA